MMGCGAMGWAQDTTSTNSTTSGTTSNSNTTTGNPATTTTNQNTGVATNSADLNSGVTSNTNMNTRVSDTVPPGNMGTTASTQLTSSSNYAAYGNVTNVPGNLSMSFQRDYPSAFSPTWQQAGDWYRASYNNMNRNIMVYYAPNGNSYSVALPVVSSFVPEELITRSLQMYGNNIYSINRVKAANDSDVYIATIIENGVSRTEYLTDEGTTMAAIDVFRNDAMDSMNSTSNNAANGVLDSSNLDSSIMNNPSGMTSPATPSTSADLNSTSTPSGTTTGTMDMNTNEGSEIKSKTKIKDANGNTIQKIKHKEGKTKVKGDASGSTSTSTGGGY